MTASRQAAESPFVPERLRNAEEILRSAIEARIFPGCVALVRTGGQTVLRKGFGALEPGSAREVTPEVSFDLASLTKPLACASSIMVLVERGALCLTDEISRFFDAKIPHLRGVTVRHLLTHTSGLPPWEKLYGKSGNREEIIGAVLAIPTEARPGERYAYSDLGYILLGEIAQRASGMRLDDFSRENLFRSLGMLDTGYWALDGEKRFTGARSPEGDPAERTAPTRNCSLRGDRTLIAEVHDANCYALSGVSGHAGLFGTADDVARYLEMLLGNGRTADGSVFFSPAAVRMIVSSQIAPSTGGHTLGWFAPPNGMHVGGDLWGDRGFGHSGFTGTSAFADPPSRTIVVLLTHAIYYNSGEHLRVRRRFHNAVAASLPEGEPR
jgi:CubicO group peptidase (beta-lactamase class C family)